MSNKGGFLTEFDKGTLTRVARSGKVEHRVARRANALILLDKGWSFEEVAEALMVDDDTVRTWRKAFDDGGTESVYDFDFKGGFSRLTEVQMDELKEWATKTLPATTNEIGAFIEERFGHSFTRSGLIKLMDRLGFEWKKPTSVPAKMDVEKQEAFIKSYEDQQNSLDPDEAVVFADAVHPTHQSRPSGMWVPKGEHIALRTASGRERMNIHGAIDLESGTSVIHEALVVDAMSTIAILEAIERAFPLKKRIYVYLDNARYHHAKLVREWLAKKGRRVVLRFIPPYCAHLNPIERLWGVMHHHVTHNKSYGTFREFADAILDFLKAEVPKRFEEFASRITDNFRVINPADFRVVG